MHRLDDAERRARLVLRHRLAPEVRAGNPLDAARSVVALHATDAVTVFLSVQARTDGVAPADVERTLYEERTLVRVLAMRRTLWTVPRELLPVVLAAATRAVAERERRRLLGFLRDNGIDDGETWLELAEQTALDVVGQLGEAQTSDVTEAAPELARKLRLGIGTKYEATQSAAAPVLPHLAMQGLLVRARPRGSWISPQFRWATADAWLGGPIEEVAPAAAQAELLRLWLRAFGPATETDMRWWTGWTARETRAALAALGAVDVDLDGAPGHALADDLEPTPAPAPAAALLPTLDPTTMGWKERDWYLAPHGPTLFDRNGNAGATIWWAGRVVGGWSQRRDGEIALGLLEDVGREAHAAIEAESERLREWLGAVRFSPGFLPPFQRSLAS